MRRLTVGVAPDFLDRPADTGAGRVHHSVLAEFYPRLARKPKPWRRAEVWLAGAADNDFIAPQPVVAICHGAGWLLDPSVLELTPAEYWKPFVARMERRVRSATLTIVPSEYTREALMSGWGIAPERIAAVHHGVDPRRFAHRPGGRRLVAEALGEDRPYVLFVGFPTRMKGILTLKAAVAQLARERYPHALVIAGANPPLMSTDWRTEISRQMDGAPGRLCWLGGVRDDQLIPLLSDADVFCLPSANESFGLPVLEAMACGTPVVAANRAALPEIVADAGLLCEPTIGATAHALRRVIDEPGLAQELAERGRARAEQLTWERTARGWLGAVEHALTMDPPASQAARSAANQAS